MPCRAGQQLGGDGWFVSLDPGIEALLHTSQMSDPAPEDATLVVREGQHLVMRVISIESHRQRLGLSLKEVNEEEVAEWQARQAEADDDEVEAEAETEPVDELDAEPAAPGVEA